MTTATNALIAEEVRYLLSTMGFDQTKVACTSKEIKDRPPITLGLFVSIDAGEEGRILIGTGGYNLDALQHIVRSLVRRKLDQPARVNIDVNGYVASRERTLLHLAEEAARKVSKTGRAIVLSPMNAAERHTIHTALASRADINTASLGEEPSRRVVVRPVFI